MNTHRSWRQYICRHTCQFYLLFHCDQDRKNWQRTKGQHCPPQTLETWTELIRTRLHSPEWNWSDLNYHHQQWSNAFKLSTNEVFFFFLTTWKKMSCTMVTTSHEREHGALGFYCDFSSLFCQVMFTMETEMEALVVSREGQKPLWH